jgi:serine/threonine protein kinase
MTDPKKIGRYEIIEEKGHGAMGAVYLARDPAMDRIVALKTIHSIALSGPQAEEFRERFYREARAAGSLAHPGIVTMFDVGEQDTVPYLVMEYIEGRTLAEATKQGERFTFERVCEIGQQIAEALGYAHKNGVVHRDIKPANVLMTSKEKYGIERPKITDFGVAKLGAAHLTTTGQMLGTPAFMPPEQFTGAPIDGRSDLFSLGVILYWMATGEHAFPGETITAVSYKVVNTDPVPPRKLNPAVPAAFDQIIMKCLSKAPSDRYATGEDLAHELLALRSGHTTPALQGTVPSAVAAPGASAMEVTLDSHPVVVPAATHSSRKSHLAARRPGSLRKRLLRIGISVGVLVLVVLLATGWYAYTHKQIVADLLESNSAQAPAVDTDTPAPESQIARPAKPAARVAKPENLSSTPGKTAARPTERPKSVLAALPAPPRVDFDPKQLDPNTNTKLKIEAEHFPDNSPFTVEMGGKIYFERGGNNNQTVFDDLYVPPGFPEFRVIAGVGDARKTSNIVSAEFKPKKKKTLHIELRTQGQQPNTGVPAGVYPDSQIVVTLK